MLSLRLSAFPLCLYSLLRLVSVQKCVNAEISVLPGILASSDYWFPHRIEGLKEHQMGQIYILLSSVLPYTHIRSIAVLYSI